MANKRRSNGEGSFWQLPDRTWVYQITVGRKADGSPARKSFKGRTKAICKQRKEEWEEKQEAMKAQAANEKQEEVRREIERYSSGTQGSKVISKRGDTGSLRFYF